MLEISMSTKDLDSLFQGFNDFSLCRLCDTHIHWIVLNLLPEVANERLSAWCESELGEDFALIGEWCCFGPYSFFLEGTFKFICKKEVVLLGERLNGDDSIVNKILLRRFGRAFEEYWNNEEIWHEIVSEAFLSDDDWVEMRRLNGGASDAKEVVDFLMKLNLKYDAGYTEDDAGILAGDTGKMLWRLMKEE